MTLIGCSTLYKLMKAMTQARSASLWLVALLLNPRGWLNFGISLDTLAVK